MLVIAEPAAIKLTALAVVLVITMTNMAKIPRPNLAAIVLGSALLGSNLLIVMAVAIVAIKPIKANQNKPTLAPKNEAVVAACLSFVKRLKSAAAVTQAKLKAAKISTIFPLGSWNLAAGCHLMISWKGTVFRTTIDSQVTRMITKMIPKRSIHFTDFSPTEILIRCRMDMTTIPMMMLN